MVLEEGLGMRTHNADIADRRSLSPIAGEKGRASAKAKGKKGTEKAWEKIREVLFS